MACRFLFVICVGCDIPGKYAVFEPLMGALTACTLFLQLNLVSKGTTLTFNRSSWESRSNSLHRDVAGKYQHAEWDGKERAYGIRYSICGRHGNK